MNIPLKGGWRKKVFLKSNGKEIVCLVPKASISETKLRQALELEEKFGGRKLLDFKEKKKFWQLILSFLPGKVKWQWGEKESFKIGQLSAKLHKKGICHFDLKPGNVLWGEDEKIANAIDFEEFKRGKKWRMADLANTLSWILVAGGSEKRFFAGYQKKALKIDHVKIRYYLPKFLKMRIKEGNKRAFLLLAKQKFQQYQRETKSKLININGLPDFRKKYGDKRIVFVVGAFELLHWGHLDFLKRAKKRGDLLIVGVASDESRRRLKGQSLPIVGAKTRAETLCFFNFVDVVVVVDEDDVSDSLQALKPDVFYTAKKDWGKEVRSRADADLVKSYGGQVVKVSYSLPKISSSKMVEKVALIKIKHVLTGKARKQPLLKIRNGKKITKKVKYDNLAKLGRKLRRAGKRVVFTSMTADLFHLGHARFLQKAKSLGDILMVGIPSNKSVTALKGRNRPIVDETARALLISEIGCVDYLVIFDERTILGCLQKLKPDIFFTVKEDWNKNLAESPEAKFIVSIGGKIVRSERQAPYISASKMIDKAAGELIKNKFLGVLKLAKETPVLNADFDPYTPENQLTARERGFYDRVLKEVAKRGKCVFCDLKDKYIIAEKDNVVLTVALYPYIDGHLLIVPRRHIKSTKELTRKEKLAVFALLKRGEGLLRKEKGDKNFWFLVREGEGVKAGKTVNHLHFHLLPYNPKVIKISEKKLTVRPISLARKLRKSE